MLNLKHRYLIIISISLICLFFIGALCAHLFRPNLSPLSELPVNQTAQIIEGELKESSGSTQAEPSSTSTPYEMDLKINLNPVFESSHSLGTLMIQNSKINQLDLEVHLIIEETNELIYVSPRLRPNQSIKEDYLMSHLNLAAGDYSCVAIFNLYEEGSTESINEIGVRVNLTIQSN